VISCARDTCLSSPQFVHREAHVVIDRDALARHYRAMPDETFTYFATHEAGDLLPEAVEILVAELVVRGTVPNPRAAVDIQRREVSSEEFTRMVDGLRREPCPLCRERKRFLDGALIVRGGDPELVVACRPCLVRELRSAKELSNLGLAIHWKFLSDVSSNDGQIRELEGATPTRALLAYAWLHRGTLVRYLE
jgi:hypothetical protein